MTRQQRQSCRKKRSKLNLFRHGDVGAVLCRCRYQLRGPLSRPAQLDAFRKV
jgi:hypothetical protein